MVRTLEDDIDFARCEISNALCALESLGLSLINGEFFEFELSPNADQLHENNAVIIWGLNDEDNKIIFDYCFGYGRF